MDALLDIEEAEKLRPKDFDPATIEELKQQIIKAFDVEKPVAIEEKGELDQPKKKKKKKNKKKEDEEEKKGEINP